MIGYMCRGGTGGNGYVYAIPKDSNPLNMKKFKSIDKVINKAPIPKEALSNFMLGIDGDKSPLSYLQAAIIYHELHEYGAYWHGTNWGRDIMMPINHDSDEMADYKWDMLKEEPKTINPHFYYDESNNPIIVFYTINDIYTITLNQYVHTFNKENYNLKVSVNTIAEAGIGIIF